MWSKFGAYCLVFYCTGTYADHLNVICYEYFASKLCLCSRFAKDWLRMGSNACGLVVWSVVHIPLRMIVSNNGRSVFAERIALG